MSERGTKIPQSVNIQRNHTQLLLPYVLTVSFPPLLLLPLMSFCVLFQAISQQWCGRAVISWESVRPLHQTALPLWWPDTSPLGISLTRDTLRTTSSLRNLPPNDVQPQKLTQAQRHLFLFPEESEVPALKDTQESTTYCLVEIHTNIMWNLKDENSFDFYDLERDLYDSVQNGRTTTVWLC